MTSKERTRRKLQASQKWRDKNRASITAYNRNRYEDDPAKYRRLSLESYARHKPKRLAENKAWREANREHRLKYLRNYDKANRAKRNIYVKNRYNTDPAYRMLCVLRATIACRLKRARAGSKSASTIKLLGCTISSFMLYIESKFEPGMSWANYGRAWEIDHELPCAMFDLSNPEHQKRCFHFSNLQPMFSDENRLKSDKVPEGMSATK